MSDLSRMSEDLLLNIFSRMEDDPRDLALLSCACHRFNSVIRNLCWRNQCMKALPTIVPEVIQSSDADHLGEPVGGWGTLFRLLVCCPGLESAGVLLEHWDFGLDRELGSSDEYMNPNQPEKKLKLDEGASTSQVCETNQGSSTSYLVEHNNIFHPEERSLIVTRMNSHVRPHRASGVMGFSREQGNKLLASRFRTDSLYICDWPGCVHLEEKRKYQIFRGIFKNFQRSQVCRNLRDLKAKKAPVPCAFCCSGSMWDMVTSFCLRRSLEYHDDGEPVVRAYVCENGHVSGAWTDNSSSM